MKLKYEELLGNASLTTQAMVYRSARILSAKTLSLDNSYTAFWKTEFLDIMT
ncbi:MAG: hypothetical protein WAM14_07265 [Candidatus Nitrosopolaris sp.]